MEEKRWLEFSASPGGGDKNCSQEGRFCQAKKRGVEKEKKKKPMIGRTRRNMNERKFPRKSNSEKSCKTSITFTLSIILYAILYFRGSKCPQNRYFEEQLAVVDCSCLLCSTLSLPGVINFRFPLQPHQKYYITQ